MIKLTLVLLLAALARAQQDPYEVCVGHADGEMVGHGQDVSCTAYFYCEGEYGFDEDCVTQLGDGHEFNYETNECDLSENVLCADYVAPEPETDAPPPPQVPVTQPPATQPPVVTPAPPATTDSSIPDITCPTNRPGEIIFFESTNCTEYFICANGVRLQMACMEGFTWNQAERQCDYPIFSRCSVSFPSLINNFILKTFKPSVKHR